MYLRGDWADESAGGGVVDAVVFVALVGDRGRGLARAVAAAGCLEERGWRMEDRRESGGGLRRTWRVFSGGIPAW